MKGLKWIACAAVIAGSLAVTQKAKADVMLAADFDVAVPVDIRNTYVGLATGAGFDARLGFRFRIPRARMAIVPELAVGYSDLNARFVRVRPGLRLTFGRMVTPYIYSHIGWGWSSFESDGQFAANGLPDTAGTRTTGERQTGQGYAFDAGVGIDVHLHRRFSVGAHAGYNVVGVGQNVDIVSSNPAVDHPKWFNFGLNASVYF